MSFVKKVVSTVCVSLLCMSAAVSAEECAQGPLADDSAVQIFFGEVTAVENEQGASKIFVRVEAVEKGALAPEQETIITVAEGCLQLPEVGSTWLYRTVDLDGVLTTSNDIGAYQLITAEGLYDRVWWYHVRERFGSNLDQYLERNECTEARLKLYLYFLGLPRGCKVDSDCVADQYIDTHQCYAPVVTNEQRILESQQEELQAVRKAAIEACEEVQQDTPDCNPTVFELHCSAGVCAESHATKIEW